MILTAALCPFLREIPRCHSACWHGLFLTEKDRLNRGLLACIQG